jgi:hypothetical protein
MHYNVWKFKFEYEFNDRYYFDTWTSYENYYVQKINNFYVVYKDYTGFSLNKYLYESNSSHKTLLKYFNEVNADSFMGSFSINNIKNRVVLLCSYGEFGYEIFGYFENKDECDKEKNKRYLEKVFISPKYTDVFDEYADFLIINLSTLMPCISSKVPIDNNTEPEFFHEYIMIQR